MRNIQSMACKNEQFNPLALAGGYTTLVKKKPFKLGGSRNDY
jgi:hypothetical protein